MNNSGILSVKDYIHINIDGGENKLPIEQSGVVDIYWGQTSDSRDRIEKYSQILSSVEIVRANKFKIPSIRDTYICCHGELRVLLADRLGVEAIEVPVNTDDFGKPKVEGGGFWFNISHSKDMYAIAISKDLEVGLDIENVDPRIHFDGVVESYFHLNEINQINDLNHREGVNMFYTFWTRKEAFLKALGVGLINDLQLIDTSQHMTVDITRIFASELVAKGANYYIYTKAFGEQIVSLATRMPLEKIRFRKLLNR